MQNINKQQTYSPRSRDSLSKAKGRRSLVTQNSDIFKNPLRNEIKESSLSFKAKRENLTKFNPIDYGDLSEDSIDESPK